MHVLVVHAHPEPRSFTAALRGEAVRVLEGQGHTVTVSDLYAMRFDPVAKAGDFAARRDPDYLNVALEQRHAHATGTTAPDVQAELDKLLACDLLLLSFPIWWFSVPAILKGWIDRVLISGACYGGRRFYDQGGLVGKRALCCITFGLREHMLKEDGVHGPFEHMLKPLLQGTLGYVGFDVLTPFRAWHVPYVDDGARGACLEAWRAYLGRLDDVPVLAMPSLGAFDREMRRKG